MAGFVAVNIAAKQAVSCYVFIVCVAVFRKIAAKKVVQVGDEFFLSSHKVDKAGNVLRNVE